MLTLIFEAPKRLFLGAQALLFDPVAFLATGRLCAAFSFLPLRFGTQTSPLGKQPPLVPRFQWLSVSHPLARFPTLQSRLPEAPSDSLRFSPRVLCLSRPLLLVTPRKTFLPSAVRLPTLEVLTPHRSEGARAAPLLHKPLTPHATLFSSRIIEGFVAHRKSRTVQLFCLADAASCQSLKALRRLSKKVARTQKISVRALTSRGLRYRAQALLRDLQMLGAASSFTDSAKGPLTFMNAQMDKDRSAFCSSGHQQKSKAVARCSASRCFQWLCSRQRSSLNESAFALLRAFKAACLFQNV